MNRGSRSEPSTERERNSDFNEAPIHESGKYVASFAALPSQVTLQ